MKRLRSTSNIRICRRFNHTAATALVLATLTTAAFAAKDGRGKPVGDGDSVPPPKEAPITYTNTELRWHEDTDPDFGGLYVATVNSGGLVVGWVQRPDGFVHGVVNVGPDGEATNTMVDLNSLLAGSLAVTAPDWRIANARTINENGLIGCELIPDANMKKDSSTVPVLLAVADLATGGLALVDPDVADPGFLIMEINNHGDLLVSSGVAYVEDGNRYGNTVYTNSSAVGDLPTYTPNSLPDVTEYRPSFNSALQIASVTYGRQDVQRRYGLSDPNVTIETWRSGRKDSAYTQGIAEDGTVYVRKSTGSVYRVTVSPTGEVTTYPLSNGSSALRGYRNKISRAQQPGEEEMVLGTDVLEIYKPNYGRFPFPGALEGQMPFLDNVNISPPHNPSSGQTYIGGYIVYEDRQDIHRSFILTPEGATTPTIPTQP